MSKHIILTLFIMLSLTVNTSFAAGTEKCNPVEFEKLAQDGEIVLWTSEVDVSGGKRNCVENTELTPEQKAQLALEEKQAADEELKAIEDQKKADEQAAIATANMSFEEKQAELDEKKVAINADTTLSKRDRKKKLQEIEDQKVKNSFSVNSFS